MVIDNEIYTQTIIKQGTSPLLQPILLLTYTTKWCKKGKDKTRKRHFKNENKKIIKYSLPD